MAGKGYREAVPSFYRVNVHDQGNLSATAFVGLFVGVVEPATPIEHWYYYAGYDTSYTCTDREYFGPK
jgi:hypothetical protein